MKLSIIVPVYNVENYILKCISSLLDQNFDDYEIIVVDDGSPDQSVRILEENINDRKVRIIHEENQGLSVARNTGFQSAQGDYIWFFDSDDWCSQNVLKDLCSLLDNKVDVVYFTVYYEETVHGTEKLSCNTFKVKTGQKLATETDYQPCAPYYIFRRQFLLDNSLAFEPRLLHEDSMFTPQTLYLANEVINFDIPVYHRLQREGSITHNINSKRFHSISHISTVLNIFAKEKVAIEDRWNWGECIASINMTLLSLYNEFDPVTQKEIANYFKENRFILQYLSHSKKFGTRMLGYIVGISHFSIIKTYLFLNKVIKRR